MPFVIAISMKVSRVSSVSNKEVNLLLVTSLLVILFLNLDQKKENIGGFDEKDALTMIFKKDAFFGKCMANKVDASKKMPFDRYFSRHWLKKGRLNQYWSRNPIHYKGEEISLKKIYAIEALARTLYGEFRSEINLYGSEYAYAAGKIILNRTEYVANNAKENKKTRGLKGFVRHPANYEKLEFEEIIPYVVSSRKQFSLWNKNDPNLKKALCPKKYEGKMGKKAWGKAIDASVYIVMETEDFKEKTVLLKPNEYFYTSGFVKPWKGCKPINKTLIISNKIIDSQKFKRWECGVS